MSGKKKDFVYHELERISQKDLRSFQNRSRNLTEYYTDHYNYFSEHRKKVFPRLLDSIRSNCKSFTFSDYQRATSHKYCLTPLSAKGSILSETGGRFNIGKMNPNIPKFAALYIADDKETAIREVFQIESDSEQNGLNDEDLALIKKESLSIVTVSGYLEQVLDLTTKESLKAFFNAIKHIKLPESLKRKANTFSTNPRPEVKTLTDLYNSMFEPKYKVHSMLFDLPSNSQILGHIAYEAGIQAIKYPSKFTKNICLAIYPANFENNTSYVEISSQVSDAMKDIDKRMDKNSFKQFI